MKKLLSFFALIFTITISVHAADIDMTRWAEGRNTFKINCASCHSPTIAQTGPALMGVTKRWQDAGDYDGKTGKQWLYTWIRNWSIPVNSKYPYAVKMQNYSPLQMNIFPALTDKEIDDLLLYIENPKAGATASGDSTAGPDGSWAGIVLAVLFALVAAAFGILYYITRSNKQGK